ncbi:MAG: hypothetical protein V2A54_12865 [Bacteroidota bacterium]
MKKINTIRLIALSAVVLLGSCQKDFDTIPGQKTKTDNKTNISMKEGEPSFCGTAYVTDLMAGQNTVAGSVTIQNTSTDLYITVTTTGGWKMNLTHIYAGSLANAPVNGGGNPQPGQFPYSQSFSPSTDTYTLTIPLQNLDPTFIVAVHAEVKKYNVQGHVIQSETAWGKGTRFSNKNWAMYSVYSKQECCEFVPRVFDLIAGEKDKVGSLVLINDENNLYATFTTFGNWYMKETAIYAGVMENIPVSMGQPNPQAFPYTEVYLSGSCLVTYTIPLELLQNCYVVAAYALVGEVINGQFVSSANAWSSGITVQIPGATAKVSPYCTQICN